MGSIATGCFTIAAVLRVAAIVAMRPGNDTGASGVMGAASDLFFTVAAGALIVGY